MTDCHSHSSTHPHNHQRRVDWLLWSSLSIVAFAYVLALAINQHWVGQKIYPDTLNLYTQSVFELMNRMWWGVALGIFFVGVLSKIPREFVMSILGSGKSVSGIFRATLAGVMLDLCSHGILLVGMKLYERGASYGQILAFLIASPWNSLSLTFIMISLMGIPWTLAFIGFSAVIAIITGILANRLVKRGILPPNPHETELSTDFHFFPQAKQQLKDAQFTKTTLKEMLQSGVSESTMILRWVLFGVVLAAAIQTFVDTETFRQFFGPTMLGLGTTLIAATIIEVCSEGSTPIAADLLNRAKAPGNSFTFLMAGVSTDYTEIMGIKERTKSWKLALFLPLLTLPQILLVGWLLNHFAT